MGETLESLLLPFNLIIDRYLFHAKGVKVEREDCIRTRPEVLQSEPGLVFVVYLFFFSVEPVGKGDLISSGPNVGVP